MQSEGVDIFLEQGQKGNCVTCTIYFLPGVPYKNDLIHERPVN